MAEFSVVPEREAPKPTRQTGRLAARMREYETFVTSVKAGQVGKLTPAKGESARGIALRVSRAAKRINKAADTWIADGSVYFKVS
ncbi:MAG: hypothetical protein KDI19_16430 [Pseudomonadales bacterium]|nr:hypothetical protein [Pseudomonadales bacterium]